MDGELLYIEMNVVQFNLRHKKAHLNYFRRLNLHTTDSDGQFQAFFSYKPLRVSGSRATLLPIGVCPISQMNQSQSTSKKKKKKKRESQHIILSYISVNIYIYVYFLHTHTYIYYFIKFSKNVWSPKISIKPTIIITAFLFNNEE